MRLGVCYYPEHWPEDWWADDARRMVEMGLSLKDSVPGFDGAHFYSGYDDVDDTNN